MGLLDFMPRRRYRFRSFKALKETVTSACTCDIERKNLCTTPTIICNFIPVQVSCSSRDYFVIELVIKHDSSLVKLHVVLVSYSGVQKGGGGALGAGVCHNLLGTI